MKFKFFGLKITIEKDSRLTKKECEGIDLPHIIEGYLGKGPGYRIIYQVATSQMLKNQYVFIKYQRELNPPIERKIPVIKEFREFMETNSHIIPSLRYSKEFVEKYIFI